MSRPKISPVERAFESFIALNAEERRMFDMMLKGFDRSNGQSMATVPPKTRHRGRPAKTPKVQEAVQS